MGAGKRVFHFSKGQTSTMNAQEAFARYEAVRARLPTATFPTSTERASGLLDIAEAADAFVFDAFGVLNVGETPIPGARRCIDGLRRKGKRVFVLTNAASYSHEQTLGKFEALGFDFSAEEIVTSRDAAFAAIRARGGKWGTMAGPSDALADYPVDAHALAADDDAYDRADGFLLVSSRDWTDQRQRRLEASQSRRPRPIVVANPDVVAPIETGFSLQPGYYAHGLLDAAGGEAEFHGKPYASVFEMVEARLPGVAPERILMSGDTLHTDVLGARARRWRTALVTDHGLFAGLEADEFIETSGIRPDWQVPSI